MEKENPGNNRKPGTVYLIGVGPGDPDLITVKGREILQSCDVVLYDRLIADELIVSLPPWVEKRYVGKETDCHSLPQEEINALMVELVREGKNVARLKGGDPFLFGRGGEEARFLKQHNVKYEVVPGITAGLAAPLYSGIPCTDRTASSFVLLATGHQADDKDEGAPWDWIARAQRGTIIIYMGVKEIEAIVSKLVASGMSPDTPAAVIERGTFPTQRTVRASLRELPAKVRNENIRPPAVFVIGDVVNLECRWIEGKPLRGRRVMVTRPIDQAEEIYRALRNLGAEVLPYPTIATAENEDGEGWEQFHKIEASKCWLVFTSENGVRYFIRQLMGHGGDLRAIGRFKIAAVGHGTVNALKGFHLKADFMPSRATVAALATEMREQCDLKDSAVVRVEGDLSDDTVESTLIEAGAKVLPLTVYRTFHPTWPQCLKAKLFEYPPHAILFTSGSTVDGLFAILSKDEAKSLAEKAVLASIGPSTSKVLASWGLMADVEAVAYNIPSLLRQLTEYFNLGS